MFNVYKYLNPSVPQPINTVYGNVLADPAHEETPPPLDLSPEEVKIHADAIYTWPRCTEVGKSREQMRRKEYPW